MGRYTEAEPYDKRSLAIREKAFGPDHLAVAESLNNLAALYERQRNYADAEPLYKRSLTIREKALGPDHLEVAQSLNNLAIIYRNQKRYADAEPLFQRSLAIRERTLGPHNPDVADSLDALAEQYSKQGQYVDAEPLFRRSLEIRAETQGQDHPAYARTLNSLATLYAAQGRHADAESLFKQSLEIGEKALGPDHPDIANWLDNYATLYIREGRYADAERLDNQVVALRKKTLGSNHPAVAESVNNLAALYLLQGRYNDALPLVREAAQMGFERKWVSLAVLTGAVDKSVIERSDALDEGYQVVQRATSSAASNAINQLFVRFAAGNDQLAQLVRRDQDLSSENERLDKLIVEAVSKEPSKRDATAEEKTLGPQHPDVALSLNNLAEFYRIQGRYSDALPIVQRTISQNIADKYTAFAVLVGSENQKLITPKEALDASYAGGPA
jgi:tetratricopeptide (TPR) repeat protein